MDQKVPPKGSLVVIFLTVFIDLLGFGIVIPLLPIYAREFLVDSTGWTLGMLMASFSAMQFVFAPIWGHVSDRIGRRPVIMIGLFGSVVFYTLFGVATVQRSIILLFVARIGAGIAGATISTAQAYIADTTTLENRPKGMALIGMAFGLGFTFGPLIGYLAVPSGQGDPGPGPGYAAAALSLIALVLAYFCLPESRDSLAEPTPSRRLPPRAFTALRTPTIAALMLTTFVCIFSFANFETTLSMVIKGTAAASEHRTAEAEPPFQFTFGQVCLTYAYIGFVLALVQGGIVRRLAGRVPEVALASGGAVCEILGFLAITQAIRQGSTGLLFTALTVIVTGFACLSPSLQSLISRRSDPSHQGSVLGLNQSVSALARIIGAGVGIPLLMQAIVLPFLTATVLMTLGLLLILWAGRSGQDFGSSPTEQPQAQ